ncbi:MAG: HAMP domain-containing histidine kinase [Oscillospiraceae bacterium]|nr:HAMP domain-containing histidine kinase [Oscillospiraceae bacterium]
MAKPAVRKAPRETITRRWLVNNLGVSAVVLLTVVFAFSVIISFYYTNSAGQYVTSRLNTVSSLLSQYYSDNPNTFNTQVRTFIQDWDDKDTTELMAIGADGHVTMTSSGFSPTKDILASDYTDALRSGSTGFFRGRLPDGEKVVAVSMVTPDTTGDCNVIRIVSSLKRVDSHIRLYILFISLVGAAILVLMIFSGMYFVKSIVIPVNRLGNTARRYARGDFSVRIPVESNDEIGELCRLINKMADSLAESEQMKNEFISSVSHELRTPLTAIKGWAETIEAMPDDPEMTSKGMHVIDSETERLSQMVEDLLDFSRMQNGKLTLEKGSVDVLAELGETVLIYTEKARQEGIELVYTEPDDLPIVYGDRNRLRQVFINVIDNAIKYSDKGGLITVNAVCNPEGNIEIEVSDNGCGIREEDLDKVKTKFFRANHIKRGSGIGLAVADEIMQMHGGTIDISSVFGEGTRVLITLPAGTKP